MGPSDYESCVLTIRQVNPQSNKFIETSMVDIIILSCNETSPLPSPQPAFHDKPSPRPHLSNLLHIYSPYGKLWLPSPLVFPAVYCGDLLTSSCGVCALWKKDNKCDKEYARDYCAETCGHCKQGTLVKMRFARLFTRFNGTVGVSPPCQQSVSFACSILAFSKRRLCSQGGVSLNRGRT